jgi:hypothetical protein
MRDGRGKSWVLIIAALVVGVGIGLTIMYFVRGAPIEEISRLRSDAATAAQKAEKESKALADLRAELASANATIEALGAAGERPSPDLAAAQKAEPAEGGAGVGQATPASAEKGGQPSTKQAAPAPSTQPTIEIASRSVTPASVKEKGDIVLAVKIKGHADKVRMKIVGTGGVAYTRMIYLDRVLKSAGSETWRKSAKAPSKKGKYRYYAGAFSGIKKVTMPGTSEWTFEVTSTPDHSKKPKAHAGT